MTRRKHTGRRTIRRAAAGLLPWALALAGGVSRAEAHDYWLEPGSPLATKGEELVLHLEMGDRLKTDEERPLQKERVFRFDLYGDRTGRRDLLSSGHDGQTPAARVRLEGGTALVVMDRKPRLITMDRDRFNRYLADEGLDAIIAQRARLGQTDAPGKEIYLRYLKVLVQERDPSVTPPNTLYKRRVGQRLEILLENDPGQLKPDGKLTVKALFEGEPLAGAKVFACRRGGADDQTPFVLTATTSAKGLAEFKLDQPELWLVRLVHMKPASEGGAKGETQPPWESFWAAYTFATRVAPQSAPTPTPSVTASPGR